MPFIPHTEAEIQSMLKTIDVTSIDQLFDEIPGSLRAKPFETIPPGLSEAQLNKLLTKRARKDGVDLSFLGAGAYEHHIPAAVWEIVSRGEYYTAYTPYQAEASQGNLQLIYEYQTMMANLMDMDCANASLYEGASSLAEACLMAVRAQKKSKSRKVLVLGALSPFYREVLDTILTQQNITVETLALDESNSQVAADALAEHEGQDITAVIVPQPNFFGTIQAVDALTNWAHEQGALVIGLVNPMAMSLIKPPGQWGETGADIVCGEGQSLGVPLAFGGPYFGFMCCRKNLVRQMPGRIVGRTVDMDGKEGFCLTLQAREQHIRRSKATSNICTNQGLLVTAATIYMSLLGFEGLKQVASTSHHQAMALKKRLAELDGVELVYAGPQFHEFVVRFDVSTDDVLKKLSEQGIQAGFDLSSHFQNLDNCLLMCSTEVHDESDQDRLIQSLQHVLTQLHEKDAVTC